MGMMYMQELTDDKVLRLNNGHLVPDGLSPTKFIIDTHDFSVGSWSDVLVLSLNYIQKNDQQLFSNLKNNHVIFKTESDRFVKPVKLDDGTVVETGFSDQDTLDKIRAVLQSTRWNYEIQIAI